MSKIKSILISDFRIYEGTHNFDFSYNDTVANLVVIYAPNGYGKTSFFDGLEWGFSNKIKRFENELLKKEIDERGYANDDQILLTNRNSHKKGLVGKITVKLNDDRSIIRTVNPRRINNQDIKYDYRDGILEGNFNEVDINKLPETNLLTQDQIDSFLRFKSPEQKFNALKEFWPEGQNATAIFKTLRDYKKIIDNQLSSNVNESQRLEREIGLLLNSETNIREVNNLIKKLKENSTVDFNIEEISDSVNKEVFTEIQNTANTFKIRLTRLETSSQEAIAKLEELLASYPNYQKEKNGIRNANQKIGLLRQLQSLHINHKETIKTISEIEVENQKNLSAKRDYIFILSNFTKFQQDIIQCQNLENEVQQLLQRNNHYIQNNIGFSSSIEKLRDGYASIEIDLIDASGRLVIIDDNMRQISILMKQLSDFNSSLTIVDNEIENITSTITVDSDLKSILQNFLNTKYYLELPEELQLNLESSIFRLNMLKTRKNKLNTILADEERQYTTSGTFNENLNRILSWGEEYVLQTNTNNCPLCSTEFVNVNELISAIKKDKQDAIGLPKLQVRISRLKSIISAIDNEVLYLVGIVENKIRSKIESLDFEIATKQIKKNTELNKKNDIVNNIEHATLNLEKLQEFFNQDSSQSTDLSSINIESLKEDLQNKIALASSKLERLDKVIADKEQMISKQKNELLIAKNKITANNNNIDLLKSDPTFKEFDEILQKYLINRQDISVDNIQENITEFSAKEIKLSSELSELQDKRTNLKNEIENHSLKVLQEEIEGQIIEQKNLLDLLESSCNSYQTTYKILMSRDEISDTIINSGLRILQEKQSKIQNEAKDYEDFLVALQVIAENVRRNEMEIELNLLKKNYPLLVKAQNKIQAAEKLSIEYIDEGINNYFNKDVINKIYSRIEPHQNLKAIDFKPDVTEKGGPRLNVRAKSDMEELNPVLYLSAAQVNILSLSIFLAKAFEMGSETISSILMDDPVQNLSDINILSFIDLIRTMITVNDKQIIMSTHDENLYNLLQNKISPLDFKAKFIKLKTFEIQSTL